MDEVADVRRRLRVLEDKDAIRGLLNVYCTSADAGDWDRWEECWTDDADYFFPPVGAHRGAKAIRGISEANMGPHELMCHSMNNVHIEVDGDGARGSAQLWYAGVPDASLPREHIEIGGPYEFEFRRTPAGWKLSKLHHFIAWANGADKAGVFDKKASN